MKAIYRLTESELKQLIQAAAIQIIKEQHGEEVGVTPQDVLEALLDECGAIFIPQRNDFDLWVGEYNVEVSFYLNCNAYVQPGSDTSYYEMPIPSKVVVKGPPTVENIEINVDGQPMEDDGTIENTLDKLLAAKKIQVDYDEELLPSEYEYYHQEY